MAHLTRSGHKSAEASKLEQFSPELTVQVLEFAELHERLNLARCSTFLLKCITKDCPQLWVNIVFIAHVEPLFRQQTTLTDEMLAALLKRVDARKITKYIDIYGCPEVRGSGLAPLEGSCVLERINLFFAKDSIAMDILRSSIPHKLFHVRFWPIGPRGVQSPVFFSHLPNEFCRGHPYVTDGTEEQEQLAKRNKFLRELKAAKSGQEQSTVCSRCEQFVRDESRQIVLFLTGPPSTRCYQCQDYFCRTGSCLMGLQDCCSCGISSCDACNLVQGCSKCARSFCGGGVCPKVSLPCYFCNERFCTNCDCRAQVCDVCNKTICTQCQEQSGIPMVRYGSCCSPKAYCANCAQTETCVVCEKTFCTLCSDTRQCPECSEWFCFECNPVCIRCKCGLCVDCEERLDVNPLEQCGQCESWFCSNCCEMQTCDRCTEPFCPGSDIASCDSCGKKECQECQGLIGSAEISTCISCNESVCEACRKVNDNGICSVCVDKKPSAKKAKKVPGSSIEEKKPRAAGANNFIPFSPNPNPFYHRCKHEWMS